MSDDKKNEKSEKVAFVDPNSGAAPQPGGIVGSVGTLGSVDDPEAVAQAQSEGASKMAEELTEAKANESNDDSKAAGAKDEKKTPAAPKK